MTTTGRRRPTETSGGLGGRSLTADIDGPVHYLDFGGPANGPVLIAVHGLGGAAVNWAAVAPLLTTRYRLMALDLAGHGLTKSAGRGTDVASNQRLLRRFIELVATGPVIIIGNSMGGMIGLLEADAAPSTIAGLILVDPALPLQPARPDPLVTALFALSAAPLLGPLILRQRRFMRVESVVAQTFALCCVDPSRVPKDIVALHVDVARQRHAMAGDGRDLAQAARSVVETAGFLRGHGYRRAVREVTCPVLLIHGERDRLVPVSAARSAAKAHPAWELVVLPDLGHIPELEAPVETAAAITAWLTGAGAAAAAATRPHRPKRRRSPGLQPQPPERKRRRPDSSAPAA